MKFKVGDVVLHKEFDGTIKKYIITKTDPTLLGPSYYEVKDILDRERYFVYVSNITLDDFSKNQRLLKAAMGIE